MPEKMKRLSDDELDQVTGGTTLEEEAYAAIARNNATYTCEKCGCQYVRNSKIESFSFQKYHVHYCGTCIEPLGS